MGRFGKLASAIALSGALAGPLEAQEDNSTVVLAAMDNRSGQVTDCVAFVREQRDLAAENDIAMSRRDQVALLNQCESGILQERIAEQERIITALNSEIAHLQLHVDEQGRVIDANNQEIARILAINGQLIIRRREVRAETAAMLDEAERILQSLATS